MSPPSEPDGASQSQIAQDPTSTDPARGSILDGKVVTVVPGQRATVATPVGLISLPAVPDLKAQASVRLQVVSAPVLPPEDVPSVEVFSDPINTLSVGLAQLTGNGDSVLAQKLMAFLPQLDGKLSANLALFVKAMDRQSGRVKLDDHTIDELEKSAGKTLASRMAGAFKQLEKSVTDHAGQDGLWKGFTIPVATGDLILPVQLYIRQTPQDHHSVDPDGHQDSDSGGVSKARDHRFLVELMLSRLGRLQMDGLVQRADKRFDLIIRTHHPLPKEMRNDITDLFITTTEAAGSRGSVTFQAGGRFIAMVLNADHTKMNI
jgi:hypothetical protein